MTSPITIDLRERKHVERMPGGEVGTISFTRLVDCLRADGVISAEETITHLCVNAQHGVVAYRVERLP